MEGESMYKVLLVEDDPMIAKIIESYLLEQQEYTVTHVISAREALAASREYFDIILLDIMLPDLDGMELCKRLRVFQHCPIIFITCLEDDNTIVNALNSGGDDYIVKPFGTKVLEARIKANLRRIQKKTTEDATAVWTFRDFSLDAKTQSILRGDKVFSLSNMEYQLLLHFIFHPGRYFSAGELYSSIWSKPSYGDIRTVQVHIHNLRHKIELNANEPRYIVSKWGMGYCFMPDGEGENA